VEEAHSMVKSSFSWLAVGSLTRPTPYFERANGRGISIFRFDERDGDLTLVSEVGGIDNPTYLVGDVKTGRLFATSEVFGWNEGTVSAYNFDAVTGRLDYINKQAARGSLTAHLSLDRSGQLLFATNYSHETSDEFPGRGVCIFPIRDDGSIGAAIGSFGHLGCGPNALRQSVSHPHCAVVSPDNETLSVPDLGTDSVMHYSLAEAATSFSAKASFVTQLSPGAGPRHLAYAPNGKHFFVINELSSTISAFCSPLTGNTQAITQVSTLPPGFAGENLCAGLEVSPDGRFLYGSNRGHDSISAFVINEQTGDLALIGYYPSGGRTPRSLAITASGRYLVVGNQNSDSLAVFSIDPETGTPQGPLKTIECPTPMCVTSLGFA
jgi:6-phosphogluconolactonase